MGQVSRPVYKLNPSFRHNYAVMTAADWIRWSAPTLRFVWNEYTVEFWSEKLEARDHPQNLSRDGRTMLKCMSKKQGETVKGIRLNQNMEKREPRVKVTARRVSLAEQA
jgi:predicted SAM-dependent methyltransferase